MLGVIVLLDVAAERLLVRFSSIATCEGVPSPSMLTRTLLSMLTCMMYVLPCYESVRP